jgi:hypothetical protein
MQLSGTSQTNADCRSNEVHVTGGRPSLRSAGIVALLGCSVAALTLSPLALPESYSWTAHTTSQAAAQGVPGAWLARLGFVTFGLAVLWLVCVVKASWIGWAKLLHGSFGVFMLMVAAFSSRSWQAEVPFDPIEDILHSVAATAMGFAFAFGVFSVLWSSLRQHSGVRPLDLIAIGASILLPVGMALETEFAGAIQRGMFLVAYTWYAREAMLLNA